MHGTSKCCPIHGWRICICSFGIGIRIVAIVATSIAIALLTVMVDKSLMTIVTMVTPSSTNSVVVLDRTSCACTLIWLTSTRRGIIDLVARLIVDPTTLCIFPTGAFTACQSTSKDVIGLILLLAIRLLDFDFTWDFCHLKSHLEWALMPQLLWWVQEVLPQGQCDSWSNKSAYWVSSKAHCNRLGPLRTTSKVHLFLQHEGRPNFGHVGWRPDWNHEGRHRIDGFPIGIERPGETQFVLKLSTVVSYSEVVVYCRKQISDNT